jgi:single-strand DNA-binding protein
MNNMNNIRNKVQLIGNVGQTPEIISIQKGKKLAKLTLATNEHYKDSKGDKKTETQWHNLIAWGKTAEIIENYVKKGEEIAIEGKIIYENFEGTDGIKKYVTKIRISEVLMLGGSQA